MSNQFWRAKTLSRRQIALIVSIVAVGIIGVYITFASRAATPTASVEVESGTKNSPAVATTDPSASGTMAVTFGEAPSQPTTALCTTGYSKWSDASTWGGSVPAENAVVTVPAGKKVVLDVDTPHFNGLTIPAGAELCLPDRPTTLSSKYIAVMGKLAVGSDDNRPKSDITFKLEGGVSSDVYTITGAAATAIDAYNSKYGAVLTKSAGTNVLVALNGGIIDLYGKKSGQTWTGLGSPAAAGASTITLNEAVSWQVGDKIVLGSATTDPLAFDEAVIKSTSTDGKTLTLTAPLKFRHAGTKTCLSADGASRCVEERSEVGLLSHSIKITGPSDTPTTHYGGQTQILSGGVLHIDNTELYNMGQEGVLGRYPLHFHTTGDASQSFVRDISTYHSWNRQLTIHGTNNLRVSGMVAHDTLGHSVMTENGYEERNIFTHNLVMTTRLQRDASKRLLFTDAVPAAYWITNGNNDFAGNSASGSEGAGFWFDPTGFGTTDVIGANYADNTKFAKFDDNIAHSVMRPGDRDEFTNSHEFGSAIITQSPNGMFNRALRSTANRNTVWMSDAGVWLDGGFDMVDTMSANNRISMAASFGVFRGGVSIPVNTGNTVRSEVGSKEDFSAWRFYHGAGDIDDMWIGGLNSPGYNVYGNNDSSASASDADNRIRKIRFFGPGYPTVASNYRTMLCFNFTWCTNPQSSHWIIDLDGSVLGTGDPSTPTGQPLYLYKNQALQQNSAQDKTLYPNVTFNYDGPVKADLTRYRPLGANDEGTLRIRTGEGDEDARKFTRDDGLSESASLPGLLNGRTYTVTNQNGTAMSSFNFDWSGSPPSLVKLVIPWAKSGTPAARSGYSCNGASIGMASSQSAIASSGGWWYDAGAKKIYVSLESKGIAPPMGYGGYWQSGNNYWCFN